jgi:hypothetical protein
MAYTKQDINQYIAALENRVSEAKRDGNIPEKARAQKAVNDLRELLRSNPDGWEGELPVNLVGFGLDGNGNTESSDSVRDVVQSTMEDLIKSYEQRDYQRCVNLVGEIPQDSPVYRNARQLALHAETILALQNAVSEAEDLLKRGEWSAATEKLQQQLDLIEQLDDPGQEIEEFIPLIEDLLKSIPVKADFDEPKSDNSEDNLEQIPPKGFPVAGQSSRFLRSEIIGEIEQAMREAQAAFDSKQFDRALTRLDRVLELDSDHLQAKKLRQEADRKYQEQKRQEEINALPKEVADTEDILALEKLVSRLDTLQKEQVGNRVISESYQKARAKYDQKRRLQGSGTTADAVNNYDVVVETLKKIDEEINKGGQNWFDDRMGKTRPIYEVRDELINNLPGLAEEVYRRYIARADSFLPHNPKEALQFFEKACDLELQNQEFHDNAETRLVETKNDIEKWEKADALLGRFDHIEDEYEKYGIVEAAQLAYSAHSSLAEYYEKATEGVSVRLSGIIKSAIAKAKELHKNNDYSSARTLVTNALYQCEKYVIPISVLLKRLNEEQKKLFENPKSSEPGSNEFKNRIEAIDKVIERFKKFLEDHRDADKLLNQIQSDEDRRAGILEKAKRIREEIDRKNFNFASEIYKELPADWKDDSHITPLRSLFQHALDHDDKLKEAQDHFSASKWNTCIAVCKEIGEEGAIGSTVHNLRLQAEINLHKAEFDAAFSGEYYDQADQVLQTLLSMPELSTDQGCGLKEEFSAQKIEIDRRKKNDPTIAEKVSDAEKAIRKELWLEAYDLLQDAKKAQSAKVGKIRERLAEIEPKLHDALMEELDAALKAEDYSRAFQKAEVLNQRNLFWNEAERMLRQKAVTEHYRRMTADLEKDNAWDEIMAHWEEAVSEFSSDLAIREELRQARRKKLIFDSDRNLADLNYSIVLQAIRDSKFELQEDQELQDRFTSAEILQEADAMIVRQEYVGMVEFLQQQLKEMPRLEFEKFLERKKKEIVQELIVEGDACIQEGRIADALAKFTVALNLDPNNITAKGRLQSRLPEVRSELRNLLEQAEGFSAGVESVQEKLKDGAALLEDLKNFRSVVEWIENDSDQYQRQLNRNIVELEEKLADMEKARKLLERNEESSQTWRAMMLQGMWTQLDDDLRALATLLTPRHPQYMELEGRKRRSIEQRRRLDEALTNMKNAFDDEDFERAMVFAGDALQINRQIVRTDNPDPFGLLAEKARVYHIYRREDVDGLEKILDLLETQKQDFGNWDRWFVRVEKLLKDIDKSWNEIEAYWHKDSSGRFDISQPTKTGVAALENCVRLHEEVLSIYEKEMPTAGPESGKAKKLQREMQDLHEEILKSQDEINDLLRIYQESSHTVDLAHIISKAEDLIQQQAFGEALDWITQGLEYDPANEFLFHLDGVCRQNLTGRNGIKSIFGGLFGKK